MTSQQIIEALWPACALLRRLGCHGQVVSAHGARFVYTSDDLINLKIALVGTHEFDTTEFLLAVITPDSVFVDVGANLGYFTLIASRRLPFGRVIAVEPSPTNLAALRKNLTENAAKNVAVVPEPLWSTPGVRLELHVVNKHNFGANSLLGSGPVDTAVYSTTLDQLVEQQDFATIDVLKIDVEGAELEVLQGGVHCLEKVRPRYIVLALDSTSEEQRELTYELVSGAGYVEVDPASLQRIERPRPVGRVLAFLSRSNDIDSPAR